MESTQQINESFKNLIKNKTSLLYVAKSVGLILNQLNLSILYMNLKQY